MLLKAFFDKKCYNIPFHKSGLPEGFPRGKILAIDQMCKVNWIFLKIKKLPYTYLWKICFWTTRVIPLGVQSEICLKNMKFDVNLNKSVLGFYIPLWGNPQRQVFRLLHSSKMSYGELSSVGKNWFGSMKMAGPCHGF